MRPTLRSLVLAAVLAVLPAGAMADETDNLSDRPSWALTDWMAHDTTRRTQEAYRYHSYGEYDQAFELYLVAASRGYPEAQLNVGNYYATGAAPKAPADNVEAVKWYLLSGIGIAEHHANTLRQDMTDDEWAEAQRRVAEWVPSAE